MIHYPNVDTLSGRNKAKKYFEEFPLKKERIAKLVYKMERLSVSASFHIQNSADYYDKDPEYSEKSRAELISDTQEEILKIVLDEL